MKQVYLAVPTLLLVVSPLCAIDRPSIREGLWSIHTTTTATPGNRHNDMQHTLCRNHAFDEYSEAIARRSAGANCITLADDEEGNRSISKFRCQTGRSSAEVTRTMTFIDEYHLRLETHVTYSPALRGIREQTSVEEEAYIGSCPSELKPGDDELDNGTIRHLWKQ
jgi:hypothetical protein